MRITTLMRLLGLRWVRRSDQLRAAEIEAGVEFNRSPPVLRTPGIGVSRQFQVEQLDESQTYSLKLTPT